MRGFTLIELIVVIVVLSILSMGVAAFLSQSTSQYLEATVRNQFSSSVRFALERISREIRDALPNSVRIDGSGNCVEFIPIVRGGSYIDAPFVVAANQFEAVNFGVVSGVSFVSIMPLSSDEVYGVSGATYPASLAAYVGNSAANSNTVNIQLGAAKLFAHSSPSQRFFLTSSPVSFCIDAGGQLLRFHDYGNLVAQSSSLSAGDLLAQNLVQGSATAPVFRYTAGSLTRNALLDIRFTLRAQNEQVKFQHEVMIRNVP